MSRLNLQDFTVFVYKMLLYMFALDTSVPITIFKNINIRNLRAILCKYGASYIGTISRSDSDFDETC